MMCLGPSRVAGIGRGCGRWRPAAHRHEPPTTTGRRRSDSGLGSDALVAAARRVNDPMPCRGRYPCISATWQSRTLSKYARIRWGEESFDPPSDMRRYGDSYFCCFRTENVRGADSKRPSTDTAHTDTHRPQDPARSGEKRGRRRVQGLGGGGRRRLASAERTVSAQHPSTQQCPPA